MRRESKPSSKTSIHEQKYCNELLFADDTIVRRGGRSILVKVLILQRFSGSLEALRERRVTGSPSVVTGPTDHDPVPELGVSTDLAKVAKGAKLGAWCPGPALRQCTIVRPMH
jgi:hypothetical protein